MTIIFHFFRFTVLIKVRNRHIIKQKGILTRSAEKVLTMRLRCTLVQAVFAPDQIRLANSAPVDLVWDEHGGTFVLHTEGLEAREEADPGALAGILVQAEADQPGFAAADLQAFAGLHRLPLGPPGPPDPEFTEAPILAAFHVPIKGLFVYCEEPVLHVRPRASGGLELTVTGAFRSRRVPCRETDLVIHLTAAGMARLLTYCRSVLQAAG
jgi:hypothetical protein